MVIVWRSIFLSTISFSLWAAVILLDPGHGGDETGAIHRSGKIVVYEKTLALELAVKIKQKLDPYMTVFLTRSVDRHVDLKARAEMADKIKADLFISIHFNSSADIKAHGFETYYLDNNQDAAVKKVERQENMMLNGEELVVNQILIDLTIQQTVTSSKLLARKVHQSIKNKLLKLPVVDRGIKPGLFFVLALSKRPGLLLEAGFISNSKELNVVQTDGYLNQYAQGVAEGIKNYLNQQQK